MKTKETKKDWELKFYKRFVFSDGYIGEQKPTRILKFIRQTRQQAILETIEKVEEAMPSHDAVQQVLSALKKEGIK